MSFDPCKAFYDESCDKMHPIRWNTVKFRDGWSDATMRTTLEICALAHRMGQKFATEVVLKNGCRADVVVPGWTYPVIEIMDSETSKSIELKRVKYNNMGLWFLEVPASVDGLEALGRVRLEEGI